MKNRLRLLREDRELRQIDVAKATGIDQKTLSNYETGKTNADSYALIRLAEFYGVSIDYILYRDGKTNGRMMDELMKIRARLDEIIEEMKSDE